MDDASKPIGCINGLSKRIKGDKGVSEGGGPGIDEGCGVLLDPE